MSCGCGKHRSRQACVGARLATTRARVQFVKSCARGGCTGAIATYGPKTLARFTFCSARCAYLDRVRRDGHRWFHVLTPAERRRGQRKACRASAARAQRRAMTDASTRALMFLPRDVLDLLSPAQLARLRVGVARLWRAARQVGYTARSRRTRKAAA